MAEDGELQLSKYQYPFAASPDIIRANQKDAYFQGVLLEQLSSIIRRFYGARFVHNYTNEVRTLADSIYLGLTTFVGNRTLGEEYCDIVQVENDTLKLPALPRRGGYIATTILLPYILSKILPVFRHQMRRALERSLVKSTQHKDAAGKKTTTTRWLAAMRQYLLNNLDTITSPSPIYAVSLATFYFTGAYYQIAKRLWGLRYIFSRNLQASDQRAGYEVLGVLLVLQLTVQSYLHLRDTMANASHDEANQQRTANTALGSTAIGEVSLDPNSYSSNNSLLFESESGSGRGDATQQRIAMMTHTPYESEPRFDLSNKDTMRWLPNRQARKCTLCLEPMKDPSSTTCGHLFCWTCICDWCKEKPECPLCRQACLIQHVLPLRSG